MTTKKSKTRTVKALRSVVAGSYTKRDRKVYRKMTEAPKTKKK